MAKGKTPLYLRIDISETAPFMGEGYAHINAVPSEQEFREGNERYYGCGRYGDHAALMDLRVHCQIDSRPISSDQPLSFSYCWRIEYSGCDADLARAESMFKTLKAIDRAMKRLEEQTGRPETFGGFVARVATALGAKVAMKPRLLHEGYEDSVWHVHTPGQAVWQIDRLVEKLRRSAIVRAGGMVPESAA